MASNEWKPLDGEPDIFKMFGRWQKREGTAPEKAGTGSLIRKEPDAQPVPNIPEVNVGKIFLDELKKHHSIEDGFDITKVSDMAIKLEGELIDVQLLLVSTPWSDLKQFYVYSPKDDRGFKKIAAIIRGPLTLGTAGTPQKPQPYWEWDSLTVKGIENVPKLGPPVMVEYQGTPHYNYLSFFFNRNWL